MGLNIVPFMTTILQFVQWRGDRAVYGMGLPPLACWECGLESHRGMFVWFECCVLWDLYVVSVVCRKCGVLWVLCVVSVLRCECCVLWVWCVVCCECFVLCVVSVVCCECCEMWVLCVASVLWVLSVVNVVSWVVSVVCCECDVLWVLCVVSVVCCECFASWVLCVVCCEGCLLWIFCGVCCGCCLLWLLCVVSVVCCECCLLWVLCVVCCQVEVSESGWSLVQRSSTDCGVSEYDRETSIMRRPWSTGGLLRYGGGEIVIRFRDRQLSNRGSVPDKAQSSCNAKTEC